MNLVGALLIGSSVLLGHMLCAEAPDASGVVAPRYSDQYSRVVQQLEAGKTDIDYRAFRESFLQSGQFKVVQQQRVELDKLRATLHTLMQESNYPEIIVVTKKMLSIDYTDMEAHKVLQQTYKATGNVAEQRRYHDIEFGLLNSIVKSGDGKTCGTAWQVVQIKEEYFILQMLGAKLLKQSLEHTGGVCDRMDVQTDEGPKTYYFDVTKVMQAAK